LNHPFFVEFIKRYQRSRALAQQAKDRLSHGSSLNIVSVPEIPDNIFLNPIGPGWSRASLGRKMTESLSNRSPYAYMGQHQVLGADFLDRRTVVGTSLSSSNNSSLSRNVKHITDRSILITDHFNPDSLT